MKIGPTMKRNASKNISAAMMTSKNVPLKNVKNIKIVGRRIVALNLIHPQLLILLLKFRLQLVTPMFTIRLRKLLLKLMLLWVLKNLKATVHKCLMELIRVVL